MIGKQWKQRGRGRTREVEDGNNRGGQQQQCLFLQQSSGNKKALKNTAISHQNGGGGHGWLLEIARMFEADGHGLSTG
jgi:hypothetical protein